MVIDQSLISLIYLIFIGIPGLILLLLIIILLYEITVSIKDIIHLFTKENMK